MLTIKRIDAENKKDIGIPNDPFTLFGRIVPSYDGMKWDYFLDRFAPEQVSEMKFPDENYDFDAMQDSIFLGAYVEDRCVGLAILQPGIFQYMYLYDLKVSAKYRRMDIGKQLIEHSKAIARELGYSGLYLQCQNNNAGAFLFYLKAGFYIGGLDTNVYRHTNQEDKTDILLYCECN